jgi:hypothetical protein
MVIQMGQKFVAFYGSRMFIFVSTRAFHGFLSWARGVRSTLSHTVYLRSILILCSHYSCISQVVYYVQVLRLKLCIHLYYNISCMVHVSPIDFIILMEGTGCNSILVQNILSSILFSNSFNLSSSLILTEQVSHPYETTCMYKLLELTQEPRQ